MLELEEKYGCYTHGVIDHRALLSPLLPRFYDIVDFVSKNISEPYDARNDKSENAFKEGWDSIIQEVSQKNYYNGFYPSEVINAIWWKIHHSESNYSNIPPLKYEWRLLRYKWLEKNEEVV